MNYVKPSVLLISISRHATCWNNAPRQLALRPIPRPSANACWSAMMLAIKRPYEDISLVLNRTHVIGYGCTWAEDHHHYRRLLKWWSGMTTRITAHASSNHLTGNVNETTNQHRTMANDKNNGGLPETSLHRRNDHQETRRKVKEVPTTGLIISRPTDSSPTKAKATHLAKDSRRSVSSKGIALYEARLATVLLTV